MATVWICLESAPIAAQAMPPTGFRSVGRAWPVEPALPSQGRDPARLDRFDPDLAVGPIRVLVHGEAGEVARTVEVGSAWNGDTPDAVAPLKVDLFTSSDFYKDRVHWSDPRLRRFKPAWLRARLAEAAVINVEHPWQFASIHEKFGGKKPIVLTAHNVEAELSSGRNIRAPSRVAEWMRRESLRREAFAMRNATRIFTMSAENSAVIVDRYDVDPSRCCVVPNGVDCTKFVPVDEATKRARKEELGLAGRFVVLFAGSSHGPNRKAAEHILGWARARPDDGLHYLVVGSIGSAFAHVRDPRVSFTGAVDDVKPWFEAADVAVNPLVSGSGTTLKQVEYMAMGLASVATPAGARGLQVVDAEQAFIREPDDIPAQLTWLRDNPAAREAMGGSARRFAQRHYDWSAIADRVAEIYEELIEEVARSGDLPTPRADSH